MGQDKLPYLQNIDASQPTVVPSTE